MGDKPRGGWRLGRDLSILALAGAVIAVCVYAGFRFVYSSMYSPSAFVTNYLTLLSQGRAAEALVVPGVAIDSADLSAAGINVQASDALLRRAALAPLSDIEITNEHAEGSYTSVTATYSASGVRGSTTFHVESNGFTGLAPSWRFAKSPLGMIDLTVNGSMTYSINGFTMDKRQVSPDGVDANPSAAVPMLVFVPGLYSVAVNTPVSLSSGTAVLADAPLKPVDVNVQSKPTQQFVSVIQKRVDDFLTNECASQKVLQPTNCPFGLTVKNRIVTEPEWKITKLPTVTVVGDGANWAIPPVEAVATVTVEMRSLYDGSTWERVEDVTFRMKGAIRMTPDGQASISISGIDTD